jgi:molecular chaperone HscB
MLLSRVVVNKVKSVSWSPGRRLVCNKHQHNQHNHLHKHSDSCWSCGSDIKRIDLFCQAPKCGVIQGIQTSNIDVFETFGLPIQFELDAQKLDLEYKELQKKLHPDKFATKSVDEKSISTNASSAINLAYQILKDPVARAEHLVKIIFHREALEDKSINENPALMVRMRVMAMLLMKFA